MYRATATRAVGIDAVNFYMRGVYGWMTLGLGVTALCAWATVSTPEVMQLIFGNALVLIGLILAQFALVMALGSAMHRFSAGTATFMFMLYSVLNGLTLSSIFVVYSQASIVQAFVTASGMFGAMSIYGATTKKDLTSWGSFLMMGVFGLIIASLVNIFLKSSAMEFVISGVGVLLFTGLTAYDTQKLRAFGAGTPMDDPAAVRRGTLLGALTLYLDFINLFLMLLRLFGGRRD